MKFPKDPIEFLDEISVEHKKRLKTRIKVGEALKYMGESVNQKGTGEEFMMIYVHNPTPKNPNPEADNTDLALLQLYEYWRKKYNLRPIQPWDGAKLRPWLPKGCDPKVPHVLCGDLSELSRAYSRFEGSDFSNYWSRIDALGHAIELYFKEIRLHKVWGIARNELSNPNVLLHPEAKAFTQNRDMETDDFKILHGGHGHEDDAKGTKINKPSLDLRLYTINELYNIETAIYSVRFWGFLKWADNLRRKLFNLPIEEFPHDNLSDINFLDNLCMLHFPWHDDVFGNGTCPKWNDQFKRKAMHKFEWGTQGYGIEFYQFHRELIQEFDNWLIWQGLEPIKEWYSNEHHSAYLLKYAFDGPWGLGGTNGDIIPIDKAAPDLTDENLDKFDSIADLATYIDEFENGIHGIGHVQNADIRDPYCNNYSVRFFGWHKWIDSVFRKLEAKGKPLFLEVNKKGEKLKGPLEYVLDTSKYNFGPSLKMPFTGNYVYQSLHHNQNVGESDPEKILWFRAEINLQQVIANGSYELIGELDSGNPDYKYSLKGYIDQDNIRVETMPNWWDERLIIVMTAVGNTPQTKGHVYEYRGFYEPKWPRGKNQIQAFVGTTLKSVRPDDPSQEGYVGSFYSVKRDIKRKIFFANDILELDDSARNIRIHAWGAGGGGGSDGPGEGGVDGKDGGDTLVFIKHHGHIQARLSAGGGKGGEHGVSRLGKGGSGGKAENGDINNEGSPGEDANETISGKGGDAPNNGGKGGLGVGVQSNGEDAFSPGGGGSGAQEGHSPAGGGGSGAYLQKTLSQLDKGTIIEVIVGNSGRGGDGGFKKGGSGASGRVIIEWD